MKSIFKNGMKNIHNLIYKNKKLLLVTLLFMFSFVSLSSKSYAFNEGETKTVVISDGFSSSYNITATYKNGSWTDFKSENNMMSDNGKVSGSSFVEALTNSYVDSSTRYSGELVTGFIEQMCKMYNGGNNTVMGQVYAYDGTKDITLLEVKDKVATWQTYKYYSDHHNFANIKIKDEMEACGNRVITPDSLSGNLYRNAYAKVFSSLPQDRITINGTKLSEAFKDTVIFTTCVNNESSLSGIFSIESKGGDDDDEDAIGKKASGSTYSAYFTTDGNAIYIIMTDKNKGRDVATFYFGDLKGKKYKEKRYNNGDTSSVKLCYNSGTYSVTSNSKPKGQDDSKNMYYLHEGSSKKSIDKYKGTLDSLGDTEKVLATTVYVAMKDGTGSNVILYSGIQGKKKSVNLKQEVTLSLSNLNSKYESDSSQITSGDWVFEVYKGSVIVAYKKDDDSPTQNGYYYDFGKLKRMYVKGDYYLDMFVAVKVGANSSFRYGYPAYPEDLFLLFKSSKKSEVKGTKHSLSEMKSELIKHISGKTATLVGQTYGVKVNNVAGIGSTKDIKCNPGDHYTDGSEPNGKDYPPDMPLNELLILMDNYEARLNGTKSEIQIDLSADLGAGKEEIKRQFIHDLLKYGKVILMFLILLSVIYTGLTSIMSGTDAEKRAVVKTRVKNIIIGAFIFAASVPIFTLIIDFATEAYETLAAISESYEGPTFYATVTRYETGWIINFLGGIVDVWTGLIKWLVDEVLALGIKPGVNTNIMQLIYNVSDGSLSNVSSIAPFTGGEWRMYMAGYRLLTSLSICLIAIGLVKVGVEYILNAGNYQKIAECKDSFKRAIFAIIGVVLAPYAFRLLLLLFNYLVAMLPIDGDSATFDINFEAAGFVGSMANLLFQTTRLRIYISFMIRKVMLAVMLLSSPIVLGMWAIDKKFRGLSLWIGETYANAATQFSYALVFLVVILISYEGQNPFIVLIIVMLIPRFANFFAKSLQGFAQRWGSINADGMADDVIKHMKDLKNTAVKTSNNTGRFLTNATNFFDKDGISKTGRRVKNLGALMQGNVLGVQTKREFNANKAKMAREEEDKQRAITREAQKEMQPFVGYPGEAGFEPNEYSEYLNALENYEISDDEIRHGTGYDQINEYVKQKRKLEYYKNRTKGYASLVDQFEADTPLGKLASHIKGDGAVADAARFTLNAVATGPVSMIQRVSDEGASRVAKAFATNEGREKKLENLSDALGRASGDTINSNFDIAELINEITQLKEYTDGTIDVSHFDSINGQERFSGQQVAERISNSLIDFMKQDEDASMETYNSIKEIFDTTLNYEMKAGMTQATFNRAEEVGKALEEYQNKAVVNDSIRNADYLEDNELVNRHIDKNLTKEDRQTILGDAINNSLSIAVSEAFGFSEVDNVFTSDTNTVSDFNKGEEQHNAFNDEDTEKGPQTASSVSSQKGFVRNMSQVAPGDTNDADSKKDITEEMQNKFKAQKTKQTAEKVKEYAEERNKLKEAKERLKKREDDRSNVSRSNVSREEKKEKLKDIERDIDSLKNKIRDGEKAEERIFNDIQETVGQNIKKDDFDATIDEMLTKQRELQGGVDETNLDNFQAKGVVKQNQSEIHKSGKKLH